MALIVKLVPRFFEAVKYLLLKTGEFVEATIVLKTLDLILRFQLAKTFSLRIFYGTVFTI